MLLLFSTNDALLEISAQLHEEEEEGFGVIAIGAFIRHEFYFVY